MVMSRKAIRNAMIKSGLRFSCSIDIHSLLHTSDDGGRNNVSSAPKKKIKGEMAISMQRDSK
jgi:hypothetical protein